MSLLPPEDSTVVTQGVINNTAAAVPATAVVIFTGEILPLS
jgi:hypothetical protein